MTAFWRLTLTIMRLYLRDPLTVALSLALIVFMMVLFGVVMGEEQFSVELPLAVWDRAGNDASRELVARLAGDDLLEPIAVVSRAEIQESIRRAETIAGLVLAPGFGRTAGSGDGVSGLELVVDDDSNKWVRLGLERLQLVVERLYVGEEAPPWRISRRPIDVVKSRYIDFVFPGILAMAIMQACLASGIVLLHAKSIGVLRRLRLTPLGSLHILGGFITGRLLVVALHLVVLVLVAVLGFHAEILASWWDLAVAVLLGTATFMSLGLSVAMLAPSYESGNLIVQALSLPMSFLCGVFFEVESIPAAIRWLPEVLPLTYLVDAIRGLVNLGLPLSSFGSELLVLAGWLTGSLLVCALSLRNGQREGN